MIKEIENRRKSGQSHGQGQIADGRQTDSWRVKERLRQQEMKEKGWSEERKREDEEGKEEVKRKEDEEKRKSIFRGRIKDRRPTVGKEGDKEKGKVSFWRL